MSDLKTLLKKVKGIVLDVDGVLTDGTLYLLPDGDQMRAMNIKDGYAIKYLTDNKFPITIISAGSVSKGVEQRLKRLGIHDFRLGVSDKMESWNDFMHSYHLEKEEILYVGDDMPDYECMIKSGVACCPADAAEEIKRISHYVSTYAGGKGCVRDIIEKVLIAQNNHWAKNL